MMPATSSATAVKTASGLRALRDEGRYPAKCRLLVCELAGARFRGRELGAAVGVRDSCGKQFREVHDSRLGVGRQRLASVRGGDHRAPELPFDDDRRGDGGANTQHIRHGRDRTGCALPVIHAGGLSRSMHRGDDVLTLERETGAQRGRVPRRLRLRDERGGPVGLEPKHPDGVHLQDPSRLFGDRFEDLDRR